MEEDWEKFFDDLGLSHIGEQIISYFGVDDLWSLRQVNRKLKTKAEAELIKLKDRIDEHWQLFPPLSWHGNTAFWKRRGAIKYIKFHQFYRKHRNDIRGLTFIDLLDPSAGGFLAWPVREENIELLKILLPGCPNAAGTQEDNEPELLQFAEKACEITNNVNIVNCFLDHCDKINLGNKDKCVQAGFVSACGAGHEAVVKRLIEVSEEDGINLSLRTITNIQIQGEIGLTETTFPGKLNIVKILLEAFRNKKIDLTLKNPFGSEIVKYLIDSKEKDFEQ